MPRLKYLRILIPAIMLTFIGFGCFGSGGVVGGGGTGTLVDSDGDGFSDIEERNGIPGTDPSDPQDTPLNPIDTDGDGCSNYDELNFINFCDNNPDSPGSTPVDPNTENTFNLTVARHVDQEFTDAEVDSFLSSATTLLNQDNADCPDVPASVVFARNGSLSTFNIGGSVVTSEADLNAIFDQPQDIKIVNLLVGVCGVTDPNDMTVVIGCAATGGTAVVSALADPDVWAHEWGHVQGLGHRDDCPRNLMHTFEANTNALNDFERNAFLSPTPGSAARSSGKTLTEKPNIDGLVQSSGESTSDWLDRVIARRYLAGIPRDLFRNADASTAEILAGMLEDPQYQPHARNIARAIGFCNDPTQCSHLTQCVTAPVGNVTPTKLAEISEAILALGRLAAHDETGQTLDWLIEGASPDAWPTRNIGWTYATGHDPSDLLARLSIKALALAGPKGQTALELLQQQVNDGQLPSILAKEIGESLELFRHDELENTPAPKRFR